MAEARDKQRWNHTSAILAAIFNARPFRKGPPVKPQQFHPYLHNKVSNCKGTRLTKHTLKFLALAMGAEGLPN
jgi:hypothetical protein